MSYQHSRYAPDSVPISLSCSELLVEDRSLRTALKSLSATTISVWGRAVPRIGGERNGSYMAISHGDDTRGRGSDSHGPGESWDSEGFVGPSLDRIGKILAVESETYARALCDASPDMNSLVRLYVSGLFARIEERLRGVQLSREENFEEAMHAAIVREGRALYHTAGRDVLGPLVVRFVEHILTNAPRGATVAFLARDAEPYFEAAKVMSELPEFSNKDLQLRYVTLNRLHFKIFDENLNREQPSESDREQQELKDLYLKQEMFDNRRGVVIVDTGCWGTMIEKLWEEMAVKGREALNLTQVYFMYSHNEGIYGFVNQVARNGGESRLATEGVFVADTFECFPKHEESSTRFQREARGVIEPVRVPIESRYLAAWHGAVLEGIRCSAELFLENRAAFPTAFESLALMEEKRIAASQEFTGVLPYATPKWSKGREYLKNWKLPPIPPLT